jgi:hypothetical protein
MGGLDLSGVRATLDDLIFDGSELIVTDENGVADDELDESSGDLIPRGDSRLYTGAGIVLPVSTYGAGAVPDLGIALTPTDTETTHKMMLPLTAPSGIRVGCQVKVTKVNPLMGDPQLVGREFELTEIPTTASISVLRIAFLKPLRPVATPDVEQEED